MTKKIIFLLTFLPTIIFGQETKKIIEEHKNPMFKEVFYVLKSDKSIRHGNYQKLGYKDVLLINGYFKNGLKDSIWEFYNFKGELEQKYDYTKNAIVFFKSEDKDKEFKVLNGTDTIKSKLERPPLYIGGSLAMYQSISQNIIYPQQAKESGVGGKVFIEFTIDSNGKASDHRIIRGIGFGCDEEALRVVKLIPENWAPALLNGKIVNAEYLLPINFQMR